MNKNCLVLSIHESENFGYTLNAAAFKQYLLNKGHNVDSINITYSSGVDNYSSENTLINRYDQVYILGHGAIGFDFIGLLPIQTVVQLLINHSNFRCMTKFTLIACNGALPIIPSQAPGQPFPFALPLAVKFLNCLIKYGVPYPVVYGYNGIVSITNFFSHLLYENYYIGPTPKIGERVIAPDENTIRTIQKYPLYQGSVLQPNLMQVNSAIAPLVAARFSVRPKYLIASKYAFWYNNQNLLQALPIVN